MGRRMLGRFTVDRGCKPLGLRGRASLHVNLWVLLPGPFSDVEQDDLPAVSLAEPAAWLVLGGCSAGQEPSWVVPGPSPVG